MSILDGGESLGMALNKIYKLECIDEECYDTAREIEVHLEYALEQLFGGDCGICCECGALLPDIKWRVGKGIEPGGGYFCDDCGKGGRS